MNRLSGFTLIELMVVVVIIAIFAVIATPSYQSYISRSEATQMQQEMLRLANLLEQHKSRNFNYRGFDINAYSPKVARTYSIELKDGMDTAKLLTASDVMGQAWVLKAETTNSKNFNLLLNSSGIRCKNQTKANVKYTECGVGAKSW